MKNNKFTPTPPLLENNVTIHEPQQKCELFNTFFASKSNVHGANDAPPNLQPFPDIQQIENINTSPLEVGKYTKGLKKSHSSHCGISGKFLQLIAQQISPTLSKFTLGSWKIY